MAHPHLENAPITEAVIDVRVEPAEVDLAEFCDSLAEDYPNRTAQFDVTANLNLSAGSTTTDKRHAGHVLHNADRTRALIVRQDGFGASKLRPYKNWEDLRNQFEVGWRRYTSAFQPTGVTRVAVRFTNRLELPNPVGNFDDYLRTFVRIGETLPQSLAGVFLRLAIPFEASGAIGALTQTIDAAGITDKVIPVIFDIDVHSNDRFEANSAELSEKLEQLRGVKNEIFFGSITAKAQELFK